MKRFLCKGCGNSVEVMNSVDDVTCCNKKCPYGPNSPMEEVHGRVNLDKEVYVCPVSFVKKAGNIGGKR